MKKIYSRTIALLLILSMLVAIIPANVFAEDQNTDLSNLEVTSVSLGEDHSAAVTRDGSLYTWGDNYWGQLGDGSSEYRTSPVKIMDNVASVSLGDRHSAAVTRDGSLYTWGANDAGKLGDGSEENRNNPVKIMDNVASVSLGNGHSAAITRDGSLYTWGDNLYGQLGDGSSECRTSPVKIMDNVASVSLGYHHSAAVTRDGSLYTWGNNSDGQLGDGSEENRYSPVKIMDNVASVSLGNWHSAAITRDGSLYTWGYNYFGELGDGNFYHRTSPVKIMDNITSVSLRVHSAAVARDGSLYTWGDRQYSPAKIMDNVASVSLGWGHSAVVTRDGSLYTWGDNLYGQLGDGSTEDKEIPTLIFGKPANSSTHGLILTDSPVKVILGKTNVVNGSYKAFESGKAQSELDSINWSIEDSSIAKVTKTTPVLSYDGNSASGPLVEIEGLKPGNTKLIADMSSVEGSGGKQEYDLAVGPAMILPGTSVVDQNWDTVINQDSQNLTFEVKASLNEPDEEYLKYFGENTKVSLEETPNSLVNGGGEINKVYSISNDGKDITITITFEADSEAFDRLVVINSPVETKIVRIHGNCEILTLDDLEMIELVKMYTMSQDEIDYLMEAFDKISEDQDLDWTLKIQLINELYANHGLLNASEGIHYIGQSTNHRTAYATLTNFNYNDPTEDPDMFCASQFTCWLYQPKNVAGRSALYSSGLILNGEYKQYLNYENYLTADYPEAKKYKSMFYKFLESRSEKTGNEGALQIAEIYLKALKYEKIIDQSGAKELESLMYKCKTLNDWDNWFAKLGEKYKENLEVSQLSELKFDKNTTLGKSLNKYLNVDKVVTLANVSLKSVESLQRYIRCVGAYEQYEEFFREIAYEDNDLPEAMKVAAAQVMQEFETQENGVKNAVVSELSGKYTEDSAELVIDLAGGSLINSATGTIDLAALITNLATNADGMVQTEACVEGYSRLACYYAGKLEEDKDAFNKDQSATNAWKFYRDYNLLYDLRAEGEKSYLKMCESTRLVGAITHQIGSWIEDDLYTARRQVCESNLDYLEKYCKFDLENENAYELAVEYAKKLMILCPVDVEIYDTNGNLIATIKDGEESDIENEYGRFISTYRSTIDDYAKIVFLNEDSKNFSVKVKSNDPGLVSIVKSAKGEETVSSYHNEVEQGSIVTIQGEGNNLDFDLDGDGQTDKTFEMKAMSSEKVTATRITPDQDKYSLKVGDEKAVGLTFKPENVTYSEVSWTSENPDIVEVKNGKLKGLKEGSTVIKVQSLSSEASVEIPVTVVNADISDPELSDQAKSVIDSLNQEDINTLQKEDIERIQDLLDQYAALSDEDKALIPEENKNKVAALTEWLNKMNDAVTPLDPSDSESPTDPGTQEIPSDSSGSQSSGTKDPVSTPGLNDQDGTQKINTVSQSVSQKIEPTYHIAPGTGVSDNTIIGWIIVLTAAMAAVTIVWFSKQRNDFKN